ncbi:MAG TPA: hypothetical protein VG889_07220 [Rhizomicrobium sp.]|nr:hypothetical protein [Rhizomicrobium sp.]
MVKYLVFSKRKRTARHGKSAAEANFEYLDASARPEAVKVRQLVEGCFSTWPKPERVDWLARFKSKDDATHWAAFFELLLHSWLLRLGYTVVHHPTVPSTTKHPDFLATHPNGLEFYLEARSTDGNSDDEARVERFTDQIIAEVGKIISSDFFIDIRFAKRPTTQPALAKLRKDVEKWLGTLTYERVKADSKRYHKRVNVGGCDVLLVPSAKYKRRESSVLGAMMRRGVQQVDPQRAILPALRKKATRYGTLDKPYVIAVNDLSSFFHEHHAFESLFGRETFVSVPNGKGWTEWDGTGLFGKANKPQNTRVSAALIVPGVTPWDFARRVPVFISNPWAKKVVEQLLGPCSGHFVRDGKFVRSPTSPSLGEIFSLKQGWPG